MDVLEFLDAPSGAAEPIAAAPAPEPEPAPPVETASEQPPEPVTEGAEQPRGPDGKFLAKAEPEPTPPAPAEPAPKPAEPPADVSGVYKALMDERDKRQALAAEVERLKAAQPQPQAPAAPDRFDDPEGYEAHQQQQLDARFQTYEDRLTDQRLNFSERIAKREYGVEVVETAKKWGLELAAKNPAFAQAVLRDADPYELIVSEHKKHTAYEALRDPNTLEQFQAWQAAQAAANATPPIPPAPAAPAVPAPPPPPRSIIHQPGAGGGKPGEQPVGGGVAFDSVFPK